MTTKKKLLIILFSFFCSNLFSEEPPKKIILLEDNLELEEVDIEQSKNKAESENVDKREEVKSAIES